MTTTKFTALAGLTLLSLAGMLGTGCSDTKSDPTRPSGGAVLSSMEYGRLVDIYTYRRIDPTKADRRDVANREPVLVAKDVVIRPDIETTQLFDASGNARLDADYRFLPFDVAVGHEELLILWDSEVPPEKASFDSALGRATTGLPAVPGSFRDQNTVKRPIPVVPRNAAICLNFDRDLGVSSQFFSANPNAIQLLEFITPASGRLSFRPVPARILAKGDQIVLDTSLIGGEAQGGVNSAGLPASGDNRTANIRVALPTVGPVSRLLEFSEDGVAELNGVDSDGNTAVIRDFRSGNVSDGTVGALADIEPPMLVSHVKMGITDIDMANRIITVNKRNMNIAIRGRVPYVDGALDPSTGRALGPLGLPLEHALRSGDVLMQDVQTPTGDILRLRAEVIMNLDVGNTVGDPAFQGVGMHRVGRPASNPADGGMDTFARLKVSNISVTDGDGNVVSFKSNTFPLGEDCEMRIHYYQNVRYRLAFPGPLTAVSDADRMQMFLNVDPTPSVVGPNGQVNFGSNVDPLAAISLRFTEPMNLETVEPFENFMLTNEFITGEDLVDMLEEPKVMGLSLLAANLLDQAGDGTLLQLRPPIGHFHEKGATAAGEQYWCHLLLGADGPKDMAGNQIDLFDRTQDPSASFSVSYTLDGLAESNAVGYRIYRFAAQDEDGTAPGSQDAFGQFQLRDGVLRALPVSRFSAVADSNSLSGVLRFNRGECDAEDPLAMPPVEANIANPGGTAVLYQCASETSNGVSEPHNPRGSRLQLTYREDDFGLGYHDSSKYLIDIEQMHWAPFNDMAVPFDVFDRYTLRMAHCDWRPDLTNISTGAGCGVDCFSRNSGLRETFDANVLSGTTYETIVKDQAYEINPNDAFRTPDNTKMVPYPKFQSTYTWRDPRLIEWDSANSSATGFGGAHQPAAPETQRDTTASISSPYVPDTPINETGRNFAALHTNTGFVFDYGDFLGFRTLDHDPIALPLLMDFSVYPDGPANGGAALGTNQFHIAEFGTCFTGATTGYYNTGVINPQSCPFPYPRTRAHATGGIDLITGDTINIDPDVEAQAKASIITDVLLGAPPTFLWTAPGTDDHVPWAQADFLRRLSMVTFGFFDSLRPNLHDFQNTNNPYATQWKGRTNGDGLPNLTGSGQGVVDLVTIMDPPLSAQPVGTRVVLEMRGAETFENDDTVFNQAEDGNKTSQMNGPLASQKVVQERGNLLNPFYACEAYRYALSNPLSEDVYHPIHSVGFESGPRVTAQGLTSYVTEDRLDEIRLPNELLPRYLNFRIIMENNVSANPPLSPALKSFAIAFRVGEGK